MDKTENEKIVEIRSNGGSAVRLSRLQKQLNLLQTEKTYHTGVVIKFGSHITCLHDIEVCFGEKKEKDLLNMAIKRLKVQIKEIKRKYNYN